MIYGSWPSIEFFTPEETQKSWGAETLVALGPEIWNQEEGFCLGGLPPALLGQPVRYAGKVLRRTPDGKRAGLQFHTKRDETFYLVSGEVILYYVDAEGELRQHDMKPGESVHVPIGAIHSVQTVTESVMFEVSIGIVTSGDTVNVEDQYDISKARREA